MAAIVLAVFVVCECREGDRIGAHPLLRIPSAQRSGDRVPRFRHGDDVPFAKYKLDEQAIELWYTGIGPDPDYRRYVGALAFARESGELLSASAEIVPGVVVWDWIKGSRIRYWRNPVNRGDVVFASGTHIACWSYPPGLKFADVRTGRTWTAELEASYPIRAIASDPSGQQVASAEEYGDVLVWVPETGKLLRTLKTPTDYPALERRAITGIRVRSSERLLAENYSLAFSPEGNRIAAGGSQGLVRVWNAKSGAFLKTYRIPTRIAAIPGKVISVSFRPDGLEAALVRQSNPNGEVQDLILWNVEKGTYRVVETREEKGDQGVMAVAYSPDGRYFAAGFRDGLVRIYANDKAVRLVEVLPGGGGMRQDIGYPTAIAFSPDSRHIAIGTTGPSLNVWSVPEPLLAVSLPVWESKPVPPYKHHSPSYRFP